jgi:hypothetical protein
MALSILQLVPGSKSSLPELKASDRIRGWTATGAPAVIDIPTGVVLVEPGSVDYEENDGKISGSNSTLVWAGPGSNAFSRAVTSDAGGRSGG